MKIAKLSISMCIMLFMSIFALSFTCNSVYAANITVEGQVTDVDGAPIKKAFIAVDVTRDEGNVPFKTQIVATDRNGYYSAEIAAPADAYYQILVYATKLKKPFVKAGFKAIQVLPTHGSEFTFDFTLEPLVDGTIIHGFIKDSQTDRPLPGVRIRLAEGLGVNNNLRSFSNGYYVHTVQPSSPQGKQKVTIETRGEFTLGYRYVNQSKVINIRPNRKKRVDFDLVQDIENAAYVVGRVMDASTGQPIPNAGVYFYCDRDFEECNNIWSTWKIITDQFGRFVQDVNIPWVNMNGYISVVTDGTPTKNGRGPYALELKKIMLNPLGESNEVNFDLLLK